MSFPRSVRSLVIGLAAGVALTTVPLFALPAAAATPTNLGVTSFGRILVDPATSHIFVAATGNNTIVVLDFSGNIVKVIYDMGGPDAMAIRGSTLYVTLTTAGSIDMIDTGTLARTGTLVSGLVRPGDLFLAGSKLWTTTGNCNTWSVQLASVDPAAATPSVKTYPGAFNTNNALSYCARFASNPTPNSNRLLAYNVGLSTMTFATFDVSTGSPVQQTSGGTNNGGPDVAVNPDGSHFIIASGSEYDEWNVGSLQPDGIIYPANPNATAIATSAGNGGVMGGGTNSTSDSVFFAYQIGRPAAPMTKVDRPSTVTNNAVPNRGVALSPDGFKAFAISWAGDGWPVQLNIVSLPAAGAPSQPTGVTAKAGLYSATVSWTVPIYQGNSPIASYTVTSNPGNVTTTTNGSTTSTVVSPLTVGTSYTFTVTATNAQGTSAPSAASNAVVPTGPLPGPPTSVSAMPGDGMAFVAWSAPADTGGPPVTGYRITPNVWGRPGTPTWVSGSPAPTSAVVGGLTNNTTYTFVVAASTSNGTGPDSSPSNAVTPIQGGNYHPLQPTRILDTRSGVGAPTGRLGPGGSLQVQITGQGTVPTSGVSAVVLNVTVTNTSAASYLTVYPSGLPQPLASNLNWVAGQTVPNLVEVALGDGGAVTIYNAAGQTDVIFDVAGWVGVASNSMTRDGLFNAVVPNRVMDTRDGTGAVPIAPLGPGQTVSVRVAGTQNIPATGVAAVVLNVTATNPTAASYLTVFPTGAQPPLASNLNFVRGQTVPNRVIVKVGTDPAGVPGLVSFFNAAGTVDVIADVAGWFTDSTSTAGGTRFTGYVPGRLFDTREFRPLGPGQTLHLTLTDQNGTPVSGESALVLNVTVTNPTAASYLTLWPDGTPRPLASDLNFVAGQTVPNLVVVKLGASSPTFDVYNAAGSTDVVIDLVGFYGTPQPAPAGQSAAIVMRLSAAGMP